MRFVLGIDASRNRSGGAVAHLVGILANADPGRFGFRRVHLWAYRALLDAVPDRPWLEKHCPTILERSLLHQLWWQRQVLPRMAKSLGCQLLFNTDAGSVCPFRPAVTLSQDMLSYEPGEMRRYGVSAARLRLILLWHIQAASLRKAAGVIFLTEYAAATIQEAIGQLKHFRIIPHGVGEEFYQPSSNNSWPANPDNGVRCLYVSNAAMYKHQWNVVRAVGCLRRRGHKMSLTLVGGGRGRAQALIEREMRCVDPDGEFIEQTGFVEHTSLPTYLASADLFVFASSCENMPVTLLEAMAAGLPIACSRRGPMPEVLADGGVYFNPEDPDSIASAIEEIIKDSSRRRYIMESARRRAKQYSWAKCAEETFNFLYECANHHEA